MRLPELVFPVSWACHLGRGQTVGQVLWQFHAKGLFAQQYYIIPVKRAQRVAYLPKVPIISLPLSYLLRSPGAKISIP